MTSIPNFLILLLSLFITLGAQETDEFEKQKRALEETKKKLEKIEENIKKLATEEKNVLKRVEMVEEKIALTRHYIQQLTNSIKAKEREMVVVKQDITNTKRQITKTKERLSSLLLVFYKINRPLSLELYLGSKTLPEVYRKVINLKYLGREHKRNIEHLAVLQKELEKREKSLSIAYRELAKMQSEKLAEENALKKTKELESRLLHKVRTEKEKNQALGKELKEAMARLENLIKDLEKRREARRLKPGTHYLEIMKGNIPWPYRGRVISYFGSQFHPKYKTRTQNTGIDIECPVGANVSVIGKGRVVYADRFMGYGNMIIVDHREGYYSIYSNLLEIKVTVGQEVETGTVIAKAKETLHFEIRREGKPVNPLEWLAK